MINDDRKSKLLAENRFYLELEHTHNGDLRRMLSDSECAIWDAFSSSHKKLFSHQRDWEWLVKCSLQRFSDTQEVVKNVDYRELSRIKLKSYQQNCNAPKKKLLVDDLYSFLFPLYDLKGSFFLEEIAEAIRELEEDPRLCKLMDSQDWEEYELLSYPIDIKWLEKERSEYLQLCAQVWHGYLNAKIIVTETIVKQIKASWQARLQVIHKANSHISYHAACSVLSKELKAEGEVRCSLNTVKAYTDKW